ncbi:unnamed protein product [Eretmochelys imbricata]
MMGARRASGGAVRPAGKRRRLKEKQLEVLLQAVKSPKGAPASSCPARWTPDWVSIAPRLWSTWPPAELVPHTGICRNRFGLVDHEELSQELKSKLQEINEDEQRWGTSDMPIAPPPVFVLLPEQSVASHS